MIDDNVHFFFYSCGHIFPCVGKGPDIKVGWKCRDCKHRDEHPYLYESQLDRIERKIDDVRNHRRTGFWG